MNEIRRTSEFGSWLRSLDARSRAKILTRIDRARRDNFGDVKPVGGGISEMRIPRGPGLRVYFVKRENRVYVLLCGGDKSTQVKDIKRAKAMAEDLE